MKTILTAFVILLSACQNGNYTGPSIGASFGYEGAMVGFTLHGENPATQGRGIPGPLQVAIAEPTPSTEEKLFPLPEQATR